LLDPVAPLETFELEKLQRGSNEEEKNQFFLIDLVERNAIMD
jgi:hypothetical protein